MKPFRFLAATACFVTACSGGDPIDFSGPISDWPEYGGDKGGERWSDLTQVTPENVDRLEVAWTHHSGDVSNGSDGATPTSYNASPLVVNGSLYICTGFNRVLSLDPETGEERWAFDPELSLRKLEGPYTRVCRGVAYYEDGRAAPAATCRKRIFSGTLDSELIALDADTGLPCPDFGRNGRVDLREGIGEAPAWEYYPTSPPLVLGDRVVIGALVSDNLRADAPAGVVGADAARHGAHQWAGAPVTPRWQAPPPSGDGPHYAPGTPNVWSILSGDAERGLVFVPTGNASPDYFSGMRRDLDYFSSSVVALDAATGNVRWNFQTVHHDVWDYDVPAQPTLSELDLGDGPIPVVIQATKMGFLFVLHRETGEPVFAVEERPVPARDVPGETVTPTQPFPTHLPPLHPIGFAPEDAWGFTRWDRDACRDLIARYRSEGLFTPPSFEGSIHYPFSGGGANWGGVSIDPRRQVLIVNTMRVPSVVTLLPRAEYEALDPSAFSYPNEVYPMEGTPYAVKRTPLFSPLGAPCNAPPWGLLTAVDLVAGEVLWESALGSMRDQAPFPLWMEFGAPNLGGPLTTAGGLTFIGATTDKFIRAFDAGTGALLWKQRLPYTANATPITYRLRQDGRQYVVIAAGGHGWSEPGDALIAYALP
ncbi:MAG: pyrroloquinoline quinone-dependent dehydrogenase [Myxococcota bacterium]|nr:pyrroloquinoline quinone-dependent dehydrogenase [Myxococcota bacterium]